MYFQYRYCHPTMPVVFARLLYTGAYMNHR